MATKPKPSLRGFWCLFVTQFQGAFSDNALKSLVVLMAIFGMDLSLAQKHELSERITALFSAPFILFSMAGGHLADRFSKRTILVGVKIFEVFVMAFVMAGFLEKSTPMLLAAIFLMGTHSAFFGPSKYSSLPELLPEEKLSWGNGLIELGTFVAIILGIIAAEPMETHFRAAQWKSGLILMGLALAGLAVSLGITRVPAADPNRKFRPNFLRDVFRQLKAARRDRPLALALLGNTYFNFLGALLLLNLFFFGADTLRAPESRIPWLSAALALGIGLGSAAAGFLSGGKIEYGLVPLGAVGLSVFSVALAAPRVSLNGALAWLGLLGFAGGFFIVPISALLQHRPEAEKKGEVLALANWLSFVGVFLVWPAHYWMAQVLGLSPSQIFLVGGVLTLAGAVYALTLLPDALLRFLLWLLTRTIYRIRVVGRENIPEKGGALFVCNHVSLVDALLLLASTDRQVRFMMFKAHYEIPLIHPFARILGVIPISPEQRPREMIQSLQAASDAIRAGEVVCIFAEGQITRIGHLLPFRRGFERIMKNVQAPIIPVALDGVWGSIFSFEHGRFLWKWPRQFPYHVTVAYGAAMPHTASPFEVRQAVQELQCEAWKHRRAGMTPLHRAFVRTARHHPLRFAMADPQNPRLSFAAVLTRSVFLARRLGRARPAERVLGVWLPPGVPGALVNFAAMLSGRMPVNLNYTLPQESVASCIRQCGIRTIVTSRAFLEKVKLPGSCEILLIEELAAEPRTVERILAWLAARFLPVRLLEGVVRGRAPAPQPTAQGQPALPGLPDLACATPGLDSPATVIFSSGSTGEPKGVVLSHYNLVSNIAQMKQVFGLEHGDCVLGVLPFFHSFGFTGTLCLPALLGIGVVYHPNPLEARAIGPLVRDYGVTFLLATPTFLQVYMRVCAPADFGSLRVVMTGAEKLPDRLALAFEEQFGIRPMEGYGCTECSPAVAVNTPDFRAAGFRQIGAKRGRIGHPLPGVCVRIVDAESRQPLGVGQPGLMLVRGPNVMLGYLGRPEQTAEVLRDGWYVTGDVATLDEDGFLQITDRLSRFSKIGGEMVPHIRVEEQLHELAGATAQTFVVTGVPDARKGERLIVLHTLPAERLGPLLENFSRCDLPNLWKPRADAFYYVDHFPLLGTGKLDLRAIQETARRLSAESREFSQPA